MFRIVVPSNMRSRRALNIPQIELRITILSQVFISTQVRRTLTYSNLVLPIFIIYCPILSLASGPHVPPSMIP